MTYKTLTLPDLILRRKGSFAFRLVLGAVGIALRLFFRRIETVNAGLVPASGGIIFVLNHPNGLIDPALVFVALPRKISFLAKSTLFRIPVISYVLRVLDALPLYRRIDSGEDVTKNQRTFEVCRELLKRGGSIALFPEGISHNSPKLLPAKTGAARIALGAVSVNSAEPIEIKIVPVGLFYTSKTTFRSEAMLHFGEPFTIEPVVLGPNGEPEREDVKALTRQIEEKLREVTINAETDAELQAARIAEDVIAATAENEQLGEKFDFLKSYIEGRQIGGDSRLEGKLRQFDAKLGEYGIGPEHLSLAQFPRGFVIRQAIAQTWYLALFLPVALAGGLLHFPAYQACKLLAFYYTHHGADDIVSTVKVLAAMLLMPLTWLITAAAVFYFWNWQAALASIPLSIISGYIALISLERAEELRGWARGLYLFLTKRETFVRLFAERSGLQKQLRFFDQA